MLRTFANLNAVELGFDANNLLTMQVPLMPKHADPSKRPPFYERIISGVGALPGVRGVALAWTLPFQATGNTRSFSVLGRHASTRRPARRAVPCGHGRLSPDTPREADRGAPARRARYRQRPSRRSRQRDARPPIHAGAIGARPPNPLRPERAGVHLVVGVVKDVLERGYQQEPKPGVYVAQAQAPRFFPTVHLIVRVDGDPLAYAPTIERLIRTVDPDQPVRLDPADDRDHRPHRRRPSPAARRCWSHLVRWRLRHRVARPVRPARPNGIGAGPGDRHSDGARRRRGEASCTW